MEVRRPGRFYVGQIPFCTSVRDGIYALGKAHMRSTPSLRSFPNVAFETVPMFVCFSNDGPLSSFEGRSSSASSFHASLLQAIDGVMSLASCPAGSVSRHSSFVDTPITVTLSNTEKVLPLKERRAHTKMRNAYASLSLMTLQRYVRLNPFCGMPCRSGTVRPSHRHIIILQCLRSSPIK